MNTPMLEEVSKRQQWVFVETLNLLTYPNKKMAASELTDQVSSSHINQSKGWHYLKGKAGQQEVMKKISFRQQRTDMSTELAARLHQN